MLGDFGGGARKTAYEPDEKQSPVSKDQLQLHFPITASKPLK